ncbi:MAG: hypothetical protein ACFBSF_20530 [Leptolyngbyaceae cyanobacterium]
MIPALTKPLTFEDFVAQYGDDPLEVAEYWIVDYRGLGGVDYIGTPKQPAVTVCTLAGIATLNSDTGLIKQSHR